MQAILVGEVSFSLRGESDAGLTDCSALFQLFPATIHPSYFVSSSLSINIIVTLPSRKLSNRTHQYDGGVIVGDANVAMNKLAKHLKDSGY